MGLDRVRTAKISALPGNSPRPAGTQELPAPVGEELTRVSLEAGS
jgi:hypothetical protein